MNTSVGAEMAKIMASYDGPQNRRELIDILSRLGIGKGKVFVKFGFCELPIDYDSLSGLARVMDSPSNRIDSMWYEETKSE